MKGARGGLASIRPPNGKCQVVSINREAVGGKGLTLEVWLQALLLASWLPHFGSSPMSVYHFPLFPASQG